MPGTMWPLFNFSLESSTCFALSFCIAGLSNSQFWAWLSLIRGFAMEQWEFGLRPVDGLNCHSYSVSVFPYFGHTRRQMLIQRDFPLCSQSDSKPSCACGKGVAARLRSQPNQGTSFHHFPCDLSAPLLIVPPSNRRADHFYVILKMVFCYTPWGETVWSV